MKSSALLLALLLPAAAMADVQFNGVVVDSNGKTKVSLINTDTLDSNWVTVPGGHFGGYTVTGYKAGRPANPLIKGDTGVKDTVMLSVGDRLQTVALTDAVLATTPTTNIMSVSGAQPGQITAAATALNDRLAQEMAKPNPDPQIMQALQRSIQLQAQQATAQPAGVTTFTTATGGITTTAPAGAVRIQQSTVNGQTVQTISVNGQTTVVQPGQNINAAQGQPAPAP